MINIASDVKICFYTNSFAGGMGDIIFTTKLFNLFKLWYNVQPYIVSPTPDKFISNGLPKHLVLKLNVPESEKCNSHEFIDNSRSVSITTLSGKTWTERFDAIFITPITVDGYEKHISHFQPIFPYITKDIMYTFSAYDHGGMKYDFPMGLGSGRLGIFIDDKITKTKRMINNPYIVIHISNIDCRDASGDYKTCLSNFLKLMVKKYSQNTPVLDIIINEKILIDFRNTDGERLKKLTTYLSKFYRHVKIVTNEKQLLKKGLNIRIDINNLPHKQWTGLYQHSLPDTLATGNQSISDIVSCCPNFNIFYQTLPWEVKFAANMGKVLKKPYLTERKTACGVYGDKSMTWMKSSLNVIKTKHNFAIKGRNLLDHVMQQFDKKLYQYIDSTDSDSSGLSSEQDSSEPDSSEQDSSEYDSSDYDSSEPQSSEYDSSDYDSSDNDLDNITNILSNTRI